MTIYCDLCSNTYPHMCNECNEVCVAEVDVYDTLPTPKGPKVWVGSGECYPHEHIMHLESVCS